MKLRLPIFGKLLEKIYMDRLARNLSTLISGGIPIVTALHTVAGIVGNSVYKQIIEEAASEVETGKAIASVFSEKPEVPVIVSQMIKIGEQTGSLDELLGKLANFYDKEVESTLSTLTTLIEPVVMVLLGTGVAIMVAGILLPIYNLASVQ
jgi:type IV pilus assembly protein PilC